MSISSPPPIVRRTSFIPFVACAAWLLFTGCARTLYFGTESSGGVKVSGTRSLPTNVSFAYQRGEIAVLPKAKNGETPSVFGGSDHDYSWTEGIIITQNFATGPAAHAAIDYHGSADQPLLKEPAKNQDGTMLFSTGTDLGLRLHLGESTGQSPSFLFGYRRAEAVIMPLLPEATEANAAYADISVVYEEGDKLRTAATGATPRRRIDPQLLPTAKNGLRIKQRFATGSAAVLLLKTDANAKNKLFAAAGLPPPVPTERGVAPEALNLKRRVDQVTDQGVRDRLMAAANRAAAKHPDLVQPPATGTDLGTWLATLSDPVFAPVLRDFETEAGGELPGLNR